MAALERLVSLIYHEKQQAGSMLCAQYALNSLLQGPYFSAPDLSEIARNLDVLEEQYDTNSQRTGSKNMDDTGFFSVQVLEEALRVLGLNLTRWRSSAMRPYQDHPHTQLAFILNLEQHWFTLRRFGLASPNVDEDLGEGHWFNLDSFLQAPERVGKLHLDMTLRQAEAEGYSVFVVMQADPSASLALSRTEADEVASMLPEPTSTSRAGVRNDTNRKPVTAESSGMAVERAGTSNFAEELEGIEDDDYELQAALQASLASQEGYGSHSSFLNSNTSEVPTTPPPLVNSQVHFDIASGPTSTASSSNRLAIPGHADLDPVAASMERNRVMLQRMREQQEFAQRELWSGSSLTPEEQAAQEARRADWRRQEEEEEEQLRNAIAESEAMARGYKEANEHSSSSDQFSAPNDSGDRVLSPIALDGAEDRFGEDHRNYDDEDAELQAALKASLENIPFGWQHRELSLPPASTHLAASNSASSESRSIPGRTAMAAGASNAGGTHANVMEAGGDSDSESVASDDSVALESTSIPVLEEPNVPPSLDEIRKARLARFGL